MADTLERTMSVRHEKAIKFITTMMEKKLFDFGKFDTNGDGFISKAEFTAGFAACGYTLGETQINDLVEILDGDNDGQISMSELEQLNDVTLSMKELKERADGHDWDGQLRATQSVRAATMVLYQQYKGQKLVEELIKLGDIDAMDSRGISCLMHAIVNNDQTTAAALLKAGANPCKREASKSETKVNKMIISGSDTALTLAQKKEWAGSATAAEFKAAFGSRSKSSGGSRGGGGSSSKASAVAIDWDATPAVSTVELMCKYNDDADGLVAALTDVDEVDKWGFSCLHQAYVWGNDAQAAALIAAGANENLATTKERQINGSTVDAGTTCAQCADNFSSTE